MKDIVEIECSFRSAISNCFESWPSSSCDSGLGISELTFILSLEQPPEGLLLDYDRKVSIHFDANRDPV